MIVVGLTGGIGSGKSTVAKMFASLNIPIYYTDDEAKKLMIRSKIIKRKLIQKFGKETYINDELNRSFLANLIFNNKEHLAFVNSIVHPKVNQHFKRWIKRHQKKKLFDYVMQENAILFENGSYVYCDKIITVTAPEKIRISRVMSRDNTSSQKVKERIQNQWSEEKKIAKSDFVIHNIDLDDTQKEVNRIHKKLLKLA